jgi:murein DD-endopeptidase MepM/ murein hydrolase activator NlpD
MSIKMPVKLLLLGSLCIGLLFGVSGVFAAPEDIDILQKKIAEKRSRIEQLEKSIGEYKTKIQQKQLEAQSLANQLSILDNRISEVQLDIESNENTLSALQYEIERDALVIALKEKDIERQKKMISEMIRTIYYNDSQTYLDIASNYKNFSDFYNQVQYLKNVEGDLYSSVSAIRKAKEDVENQKIQTEERKKAYEKVKLVLVDKKQDFKDEVFLKEDLLTQTHQSEVKYKTLLSSLKSQYQQIEGEITGIEKEVRKKLDEQNKLKQIEDSGGSAMSWPVPSKKITAQFHDPSYPYRHVFEHSGTDIRASQGTPIKAASSGYVGQARRCSAASCYSYVLIIHQNGLSTVYGHMSAISVKIDQFVTRGDIIGYSGGTPGTAGAGPFVTGPHLHFEVRKNGIPINSVPFLMQ